jgi:hypothetical protein
MLKGPWPLEDTLPNNLPFWIIIHWAGPKLVLLGPFYIPGAPAQAGIGTRSVIPAVRAIQRQERVRGGAGSTPELHAVPGIGSLLLRLKETRNGC